MFVALILSRAETLAPRAARTPKHNNCYVLMESARCCKRESKGRAQSLIYLTLAFIDVHTVMIRRYCAPNCMLYYRLARAVFKSHQGFMNKPVILLFSLR